MKQQQLQLPVPNGKYVQLINMDHIVDVALDDDGLVKTIYNVFDGAGYPESKYGEDVSETLMEEIHEEINRGKWEEI